MIRKGISQGQKRSDILDDLSVFMDDLSELAHDINTESKYKKVRQKSPYINRLNEAVNYVCENFKIIYFERVWVDKLWLSKLIDILFFMLFFLCIIEFVLYIVGGVWWIITFAAILTLLCVIPVIRKIKRRKKRESVSIVDYERHTKEMYARLIEMSENSFREVCDYLKKTMTCY